MAELISKSPLDGRAPAEIGAAWLSEVVATPITCVAPFRQRQAEADEVLRSALGLGFPEPGAVIASAQARCVWSGREQAFLIGAAPPEPLGGCALVTDITDGWAMLRLGGAGAEDVLARLVPVDLRAGAFAPGRVLRSELAQMMALIRRTEDDFEIMVMRSFAESAWSELQSAMETVAARPRTSWRA